MAKKCLKIVAMLACLLFAGPGMSVPLFAFQASPVDVRTLPLDQGAHVLSTPWEFYWQQLLEPGQIGQDVDRAMLGRRWELLKADRGPYPNLGYATYIYRVKGLEKRLDGYELWIQEAASAMRVYVYPENDPGRMRSIAVGNPGTSEEQVAPRIAQTTLPFYPRSADEVWVILIQVANFHYARGGLRHTPEIGPGRTLGESLQQSRLTYIFAAGALLIIAVYNISFYLRRRKDRASLMLGLFAILVGIRALASSEILEPMLGEASAWIFELRFKIEYLTIVLPPLLFSHFLVHFFPRLRRHSWLLPQTFTTTVVCCIILVNPAAVYTSYLFYIQLSILPVMLFHIWMLLEAAWKKQGEAGFLLGGACLICVAIAYDVGVSYLLLPKPYLVQYGVICFVVLLIQALGKRQAEAFETIEHLSNNLQEEVDAQTQTLRVQRDLLEEQKTQLLKAHDELQQLDEQKSRFFAGISHELRTPLTLILGGLKAAKRQEQVQEHIDQALRHGQRLFRLVNQLLDFQKLSLNGTIFRLERINLVTFVKESVRYFAEVCRQREIELELVWEQEEEAPIEIKGQIDALEKILFNFLSNALKFTPAKGRITIIVSHVHRRARITVKDTGVGIPKAEQGRLFRVFSQVEGQHQTGQEGTGLGLALAKELAQKMNGQVGMYSEVGQGASFWVEFPSLTEEQASIDLVYVDIDKDAAAHVQQHFASFAPDLVVQWVGSLEEARKLIYEHTVHALVTSAEFPDDGAFTLLDQARSVQDMCWTALVADQSVLLQHRRTMIDTSLVQAMYHKPFSESVLAQWIAAIRKERHEEDPVLDLLYVEDDKGTSEFFQMALEQLATHTRYRIVQSVDQAKTVLERFQVRVLLCDVMLGEEDGTEVLRYAAQATPKTFRIMITAQSAAAVLEAGINQAHVHYVIYKPCNVYDEIKVIEEFIGKSPIQRLEQSFASYQPRDWHFAELESASQTRIQELPKSKGESLARILVVDDVLDMRRLIAHTLSSAGYEIYQAEHGQEALEFLLAPEVPIDLVVSDWMMPIMSGPELVQALRQNEELSSIPVILLTARSDELSRAQATRAGASAYLSKPFDELDLVSTVENLLDLKKREKRIAELNRFIAQNVLQRFLPPALVEDIVQGRSTLDDRASLREVTVVFADLCDFTRTTEKLSPDAVARVLNAFFVRMSEVIFGFGGTIDKFIGDGIMIIFGAPHGMSLPEQAQRATDCAQAMQLALEQLNQEWERIEHCRFQMRIGLHQGPAVVGSFGGPQRSDYTVVGFTVNVASRIENLAKPGQVLLTEPVARELESDRFQPLGAFRIRGIDQEMPLFELKMLAPGAALSA